MTDTSKMTTLRNVEVEYLQTFMDYYKMAQRMLILCRKNSEMLVELFDCIHTLYVMLMPYSDGESMNELMERHNRLRKKIDNYAMMHHGEKKNNFGSIYYELDELFTKINMLAAKKKFFGNIMELKPNTANTGVS